MTIRSLLGFIITGSNSINYDKLIQRCYGLFITIFFSNQEVFLYFYQETILLYCYLYRSFSILLYFSLNFNIYGIHSSHQVIS